MSTVEESDINGLSSEVQNLSIIATSIKNNKEQIHLQTTENNRHNNEDATTTKIPSTVIICDAWYGFPTQKRPRQERILAVSKQIYNYIEWNNTYLQEKIMNNQCSHDKEDKDSDLEAKDKNEDKSNNNNNKNHGKKNTKRSFYDDMFKMTNARVYVIGKDTDVDSIQKRVDQLLKENNLTITSEKSNNNDDRCSTKTITATTNCSFLPGKSLEDLCKELMIQRIKSSSINHTSSMKNNQNVSMTSSSMNHSLSLFNDTIAYLSPDADKTLNPTEPPPSIVVVGMLVDRKVKQNRSKSRAEEIIQKQSCTSDDKKTNKPEQEEDLIVKDDQNDVSLISQFTCARLPLDALNTSDLGSDEALNIDTVLEMIQRWWYNYGKHHSKSIIVNGGNNNNKNESNLQLKLFQDAAARAMLTHRNRHPKRTIHCPR